MDIEARAVNAATYADDALDEGPASGPVSERPEEPGTRAGAIVAGALRDVSHIARAEGWRWPTAVTREAWEVFAAEPAAAYVWPARRRQPLRVVGRGERRVRFARRGPARASKALHDGHERGRVRLLLRAAMASMEAARREGAVLVEVATVIGRFVVDVRDRRRFRVDAPTAAGRVELVAALTAGDEGEPVITIALGGGL